MVIPSLSTIEAIYKIPVTAPGPMGIMQVPAGPSPVTPVASVDYSKWIIYGGLALVGLMLLTSTGGGGGRRR